MASRQMVAFCSGANERCIGHFVALLEQALAGYANQPSLLSVG